MEKQIPTPYQSSAKSNRPASVMNHSNLSADQSPSLSTATTSADRQSDPQILPSLDFSSCGLTVTRVRSIQHTLIMTNLQANRCDSFSSHLQPAWSLQDATRLQRSPPMSGINERGRGLEGGECIHSQGPTSRLPKEQVTFRIFYTECSE